MQLSVWSPRHTGYSVPDAIGAGAVAIDRLVRLGWIGPGTLVALETGADEQPDIRVADLDAQRRVGKAMLHIFRGRTA